MGVTKQAAQKRFTARDEPLLPEGKAFSHFTPRARMAVAAAGQLAQASDADALDTPHLAAGTLLDRAGLAAKATSRLGVNSEQVYDALGVGIPTLGADPEPAALSGLQYTADCKEAFKQALRAALRLGHNYIGTEHLLLGVIANDGPVLEAFSKLGLRADLIEVQSLSRSRKPCFSSDAKEAEHRFSDLSGTSVGRASYWIRCRIVRDIERLTGRPGVTLWGPVIPPLRGVRIPGRRLAARPRSSIRQTSTLGSGQTFDDEPIGVINHLSELVKVDRSVEIDRVPMALVLVVARANR